MSRTVRGGFSIFPRSTLRCAILSFKALNCIRIRREVEDEEWKKNDEKSVREEEGDYICRALVDVHEHQPWRTHPSAHAHAFYCTQGIAVKYANG